MTRLTAAELRAICMANPDFAARNAQELKKLTGSVLSDDVRKLNIGIGSALIASQDSAQALYDLMRVHAHNLYVQFVRELPFEEYRIDLAAPRAMLAVECNGGRWLPGGGKHGTERDRRKIRRLTLAGWMTLEYSTELLETDPRGIIEEIRTALAMRGIAIEK